KQRYEAYAALPNPEQAATEQLAQREAGYNAIDGAIGEVDDAIGATQAMSVALRKYSTDAPEISAGQNKTMASTLDEAAREAQAIENELDGVRRELQLGRDLAAIGDGPPATRPRPGHSAPACSARASRTSRPSSTTS